jgi:Domain of unknown function (DUF4349)
VVPLRGRAGILIRAASLLMLGAVTAVACGGGGGGSSTAGRQGVLAPAAATAAGPGASDQEGGSTDSGAGSGSTILGEFQVPEVGPRVIKTAAITLQLEVGTFEHAMQTATLVAAGHGGFVASSRSSGERLLTGTIVVRIPADQFEAALDELRGMGTVVGEELSGQDVSAQFVDLDARLRNWEAQETVLLGLMQKATTIDDSIKVQRSLEDVQLAIEQLRGQIRLLGDQADFSTITVTMSEVAAAATPVPKPRPKPTTFARAWSRAVHGLAVVGSGVVVAFGYLLPILLFVLVPLAIGWLVYRRARERSRSIPANV